MSSQRPPSSSKSRSFSNLEAKDILKEPRRKRGDESIWTTSDDPEIAHIEFEKTRAEDYDLPIGWSKIYSITDNKWFFANSKTQTTTWVDPRDKYWKPATWAECDIKTDETPYGWEIAHDPLVGTYFINHIQHSNTLDDPRINKFDIQIKILQEFFDSDVSRIMAVKNFQIQESSQEIEKLRNEINSYDVKNESLRLYTILIESKSRLSRLELIHKRLVLELEDTIEDINQLSLMTDRLLSFDNAHHQDQLQSQRNLQLEIEDLKNVFMEQVKIRECLEGDLELILEVDLQDPDAVCPAPLQYEKQETSFNAYVDTNGVTPSLKSTRLERELGFLELKKQSRAIKRQNAYLSSLVAQSRQEMEIALRDSDRSRWVDPYGRLVETPWSIKINEYVCHIENQEFSELELKVKEGKELTFHEKIYLLACSSKEIWSNFQ